LEGIPVLKEKEVYLAAIHTSVGSGSGTLHAGFERLAQDLLGAWTSDHPVGKIPQQVVLDEAGIVRMSGRSDGFVITMRKSDAN
jgi:hypothetical protein